LSITLAVSSAVQCDSHSIAFSDKYHVDSIQTGKPLALGADST